MKLQTGKCLPTSFAMCCDVPVCDFIDQFIIAEENWHLQECMLVAWKLNFISMPFYKHCELGDPFNRQITTDFTAIIDNSKMGVLIEPGHAKAFSKGWIYDPRGFREPLGSYNNYDIVVLVFKIW